MKRDRVCSVSLNPAIDKTVFVDNFTLNNVNRASVSCCVPGSKGVNVARILARSGVSVVCSGLIGGAGGDYIIRELKKDGVVVDFVKVAYDVRTNIKLVDLKRGTYTDINFTGNAPDPRSIIRLKEKVARLAKKSKLVALGGSLPPGVDDSTYYELAMAASKAGAAVSVDCCGDALRLAFDAKPFIIKPNLYELEVTLNIKCETISSVVDAAVKLHNKGIENVLVSLGDEGAVAVCGGDVFRLHARRDLPVYNTVGAGDAFLSGFIYGWINGIDVPGCLSHALSFSQARITMKADDDFTLDDLTAFANASAVEVIYENKAGTKK